MIGIASYYAAGVVSDACNLSGIVAILNNSVVIAHHAADVLLALYSAGVVTGRDRAIERPVGGVVPYHAAGERSVARYAAGIRASLHEVFVTAHHTA